VFSEARGPKVGQGSRDGPVARVGTRRVIRIAARVHSFLARRVFLQFPFIKEHVRIRIVFAYANRVTSFLCRRFFSFHAYSTTLNTQCVSIDARIIQRACFTLLCVVNR
jgi:hypothetical protein